jgi:hypothetical protein
MDSAELGFRLRQELREEFDDLHDAFDGEPVVDGYGSYGDFQLVGHGKVTNDDCGKFSSFYGCVRTDLHDHVGLDGVNYEGKAYVKPIFHSCDKPSCPVCYLSWASREAHKIEARLAEGAKRFGLVEHAVASIPVKDYGLSYEVLRGKAVKALFVRGVVGGALLFHGFRFNRRKQWYWSPHFHVLGFVLGGYVCRGCKKVCFKGCGKFEDKTRRCNESDGFIVKVLDKRKSVFWTAYYQLNHSSLKVNAERFHIATWFGVCSYRKLKVTIEKRKELCPVCGSGLFPLFYYGVKRFVLDRDSPDYRRDSVEDLMEGGRVVWVVRERSGKHGGV